ncbi:MAG: hypothetical protein ACYDCH_01945 [Gaiellaceae bacterium]
MNRFSRLNPTVRGLLVIAFIAGVVVLFQLYTTLVVVLIIARVAFLLAIAFFLFLMWRERREEISAWPRRAAVVFYGAAILAVADIAIYSYAGAHGFAVIAFVATLAGSGFAMWRTWRDQHHYA